VNIGRVPILVYHRLSKRPEPHRYTLTEELFDRQMRFLRDHHATPILAQEYYDALTDPQHSLPSRPILITFDDGHESNHSIALPILAQYGFKATMFVTSDWIDREGYTSSSQLKELHQAGMSIQSHGKTHTFLDRVDAKTLHEEFAASKDRLEAVTGAGVSFLAFPGGRYDQAAVRCGAQLHFAALFSSMPFYLNRVDRTFVIGRYNLKRSPLAAHYFERVVNAGPLAVLAFLAADYGKSSAKNVLGERLYRALWKRFVGRN